MSHSYWRIVAAIGCLTLCGASAQNEQQIARQGAESERIDDQASQQTGREPPAPPPVESENDAHRREATAAAKASYDERNLEVQRRVAEYTEQSVKLTRQALSFTRWAVALTTIESLLFLISTVLTFLAVREARRSGDIADSALANQTRPILLTKEIAVGDLARDLDEADKGCTEITHQLNNHGVGVAWILSRTLKARVVHGTEMPVFSDPEPDKMLWPIPTGTWFGLSGLKGEGLLISAQDRKDVSEGAAQLFLYGRTTYRDGGRKEYVFRYVYAYRVPDKKMVPFDDPYWEHT